MLNVVEAMAGENQRLRTEELALRRVHEGRHYKKLIPLEARHRRQLAEFLKGFWCRYRKPRSYREQPAPEEGYPVP